MFPEMGPELPWMMTIITAQEQCLNCEGDTHLYLLDQTLDLNSE